jgi:Fe2+ transport system protein FeoA
MKTVSLLLALVATPLMLAQSALDSWDNLKRLRTGQKIEVVDVRMKPLLGQFLSHSEDAIYLRVDQGQVSIARSDVASVKVRVGPRRGRNALAGLALGAAGGLVVGAVAQGTPESGEAMFGPILGALIGMPIGAAVGAVLPGLHPTIYRVKSLPTPR